MNRGLIVDNVRKFTLVRPSYPNRQILQVFGYYPGRQWELLGSSPPVVQQLLIRTSLYKSIRRQFIERGLRYDE